MNLDDIRPNGLKLDWKKELPNEQQINKMWQELSWKPVKKEFEFITHFKETFGGFVHFLGYEFSPNDDFDFFAGRGRLDEIDFYNKFLLTPQLRRTFPDTNEIDENYYYNTPESIEKFPFRLLNSFTLSGELASWLYSGGAYGAKIKRTHFEAKEQAEKFCKELMGKDYSDLCFYSFHSNRGWNSWFDDFIIDHTYLIFPLHTRIMWMLAFTDSD